MLNLSPEADTEPPLRQYFGRCAVTGGSFGDACLPLTLTPSADVSHLAATDYIFGETGASYFKDSDIMSIDPGYVSALIEAELIAPSSCRSPPVVPRLRTTRGSVRLPPCAAPSLSLFRIADPTCAAAQTSSNPAPSKLARQRPAPSQGKSTSVDLGAITPDQSFSNPT